MDDSWTEYPKIQVPSLVLSVVETVASKKILTENK